PMDEVTKNMVTGQLKSAKTDQALHDSMVSAMIAMVDCQFKTGLRVKRQGLILAGIGVIFLVSLLCGDASALKLLCFWRGGGTP
ncbi:MAG: hypothetical protein II381_14135, partial [Victivallales bacterium]|nr:hypothetical protein [Victivallales bacterium]